MNILSKKDCHALSVVQNNGQTPRTLFYFEPVHECELKGETEKTPQLIFLINKNGGGGLGRKIFEKLDEKSFGKSEDKIIVYDIMNFSGDKYKYAMGFDEKTGKKIQLIVEKNPENVRIVFCGGDGTITWGFQIMKKLKIECPVAFMPLGTANEIAKCTGWKNSFKINELENFIKSVQTGKCFDFDTWEITYNDKYTNYAGRRPSIMAAFLSLGFDAAIAHKFHKSRQEDQKKKKKPTVIGSKIKYVKSGLKTFLTKLQEFGDDVKLKVDGKYVDVHDMKCVQLLNICSMSDGCDFWGNKKNKNDREVEFTKQSICDKKLEVVGHKNLQKYTLHFTKTLRTGSRLAQGKEINIKINKPTEMEVDGEPFTNPKGTVTIKLDRQWKVVKGPYTNWATKRVLESAMVNSENEALIQNMHVTSDSSNLF